MAALIPAIPVCVQPGVLVAICVEEDTLDDVMRQAIGQLLEAGERPDVSQTRGGNIESLGARLQLNNPRARLSRTESRRKVPTAIAELAWYLSGSDSAAAIAPWIGVYTQEAEPDGRVHGAYGPRLFGAESGAQFERVVQMLRESPGTRRAVIAIFDRNDNYGDRKENVPCTCTLQFLCRNNRLHMVTSMRSNDAVLGLPHDVFAFTMLQEVAARELDLDLGVYIHQAASFHLYDNHVSMAEAFLAEGWQATTEMPPIPRGSQAASLGGLVAAEQQIREGVRFEMLTMPAEPYWADLVRILAWETARKERDIAAMQAIAVTLVNDELREFALLT
ncbi:thymidylate synthase [Ruania rhizosphaerae]|uniref:thymidylate synthase n=1 Tax=Ruania rhizosphaerae TaxID=1840413 RepID=UPI001356C7AE|nr:thymidylate synthase [Ruania rhizosphaerae]